MQREFQKTKDPFIPAILYKDKGKDVWIELQEMPENEQKIIVMKLEDDLIGKKKVADARLKGARTPYQVLEKVAPQLWGKLTAEFDIDGDKLNFENI